MAEEHEEHEERTAVEVALTEATIAYNEAAREDDAAKIETAEKRLDDALAKRLEHLKKYEGAKEAPKTLMERASFGRFVQIALGEESYDGVEKELNAEMGFKRGQFPIEMLLGKIEDTRFRVPAIEDLKAEQDLEKRADAVTNIDVQQTVSTRPIMQSLFKPAVISRLGLSQVMVPHGETRFGWVSTGATAAVRKRGEAQDATAMAITSIDVEPRRVTASLLWDGTSIMQVGNNLETVLRENTRLTLDDKIQDTVMNGHFTKDDTSKTPALNGIIGQINSSGDNTSNDDTKATAADWIDTIANYDDDLELMMGGGRLVIGAKTLAAMMTTNYGTSYFYPVTKLLREEMGVSIVKTGFIPAQLAASGTAGAKQDALYIGRPDHAVMAIWNNGTIIYDPYTESSKDQMIVRIHAHIQMAYPRAAANSIYGWRRFKAVNTNKT